MGIALPPAKPEFAIVDEYCRRAKREPTRRGDLEISRTDTFKPNFLDLVRMLVAKQQSHVVIVSGSPRPVSAVGRPYMRPDIVPVAAGVVLEFLHCW